ncbi:hypothetical protein D9V86_06175 [Bacteroidetes/Chlorobi group bacterium ChocPot_Mid]|nr:MAG: hypothetical protein D9V86_06175 [Bacteroidetes/Chlorobi group bacterium ChocPot_Mid]
MNQVKEKLINLKGFGNPESNFWFVGIEEAKVPSTCDIKKLKDEFDFEIRENWYEKDLKNIRENKNMDGYGHGITKIYNIMAKIIIKMKAQNNVTPRVFINEHLFYQDGCNFQMNLFPIGRNKTSDKISKSLLNEFGFDDDNEYFSQVKNIRFEKLRGFIELKKPKYLICFGKGKSEMYWDNFKDMMFPNKEIFIKEDLFEYKIINWDSKQTVMILTPFFNNNAMRDERIGKLVELMNNFKTIMEIKNG